MQNAALEKRKSAAERRKSGKRSEWLRPTPVFVWAPDVHFAPVPLHRVAVNCTRLHQIAVILDAFDSGPINRCSTRLRSLT